MPHVVTSIPSYGEDRIFAKEQALIDLVRAELEQNRPCVIYIRQTATRDIQPRSDLISGGPVRPQPSPQQDSKDPGRAPDQTSFRSGGRRSKSAAAAALDRR